jgi:small subunit ribosomal protein S6
MPANVYEGMFLLDTNKVAGDENNAAKQIQTILDRNQAELLVSKKWDERRLAYPIGNHKKGLYYLTYFRTDAKNITGIEHDSALSEMVLRSLILKIEPKLVDAMLTVARTDGAHCYQSVTEPQPDEEGGMGGEGGERRGPRGPRREEEPVPDKDVRERDT